MSTLRNHAAALVPAVLLAAGAAAHTAEDHPHPGIEVVHTGHTASAPSSSGSRAPSRPTGWGW
jgi:hypothetical protein